MKKKVLATLLASTMVLSLAACGGSTQSTGGSTDENGEFTMDEIKAVVNGTVVTQDNYLNEFGEQLSEAIGVTVNFNPQDHSGYADAVGRIMAGGTDWDVMIMSSEMYFTYAQLGALYDMTDLYENADFQSRLKVDPNQALYINGRLYGMGNTIGNGCVTYIKKAWLDAVGMDAPTTYEEYLAVCDAFVNQDPDGNGKNDTYAISAAGLIGSEAPYVNYLPEFYQDAYPEIIQDDNGVWYDGFNTQEMKDALQRLRDAYVAGYIDPETLTQQTKDVRNKFYDDQFGIFTYWAGTWQWNLMTNLASNDKDNELVVLEPIAEVGAYLDRTATPWVMNANLTDEEAAFIFDHFFETMLDGGEVMTLWAYGAKGYHWDNIAETVTWGDSSATYEEGTFHMLPSAETPDTLYTKNHIDETIAIVDITEGPSLTRVKTEQDEVVETCNDFFMAHCVEAPLAPTTDLYNDYKGDIVTAKSTVVSAVVVEGMDIEEAMQTLYVDVVGAQVDEILAECNG